MVRTSALLPLLAAAGTVVGRIAIPNRYVVEFAEGADVTGFYDKLVDSAIRARKNFTSQYFRGASIELTNLDTSDQTIDEIRRMPNLRVYPVTLIPPPDDKIVWTGTPKPQTPALQKRQRKGGKDAGDAPEKDVFSTHIQTQIDQLRAKGLTGKGLRIGVIDTGIDYNHPSLGGCYGPGCLVSYGWDFAGDDYTGGTSTPVKDWDPIDCNGHGTHVAGTIAAQTNNEFGIEGAAPGVTLGAYKVFGCNGGVENDVLIEAFIRAADDGSNIITASIGGPAGWSEDPWCVAVQRIVERGIPCTLAAGNAGDQGLFYASSAASGKGVISVASVDNIETPELASESNFTIEGGESGESGTFLWTAGAPNNWTGAVDLPLHAYNFNITDPANACEDWPEGTDLTGQIAFIRRGNCTFVRKAQLARAKGAEYVLLYNNVPGIITVDVSEVPGIKAIGMVSPETGEQWIKELKGGSEVRITVEPEDLSRKTLILNPNNATGNFASLFTSWGPSWELDAKPIIAAPGGGILSTYPLRLGGFGVLSGTSMATPLVAGTLALLMEARGKITPSEFERFLSNTAKPILYNNGSATFDYYAPVAQQGNGVIHAYDAAFATTILDKSNLAFNDSDNRIASQEFTIVNLSDEELTYHIGNLPAATAYLKNSSDAIATSLFPNELTKEYTFLSFDPESLTIPPGQAAAVKVTPTPAGSLDAGKVAVWSGWVTVNASDGSLYHLAYQGATGSLHNQTVIQDIGLLSIPLPGGLNETIEPVQSNNYTFRLPLPGTANLTTAINLASTRFPGVLINLAVGSIYVDVEIVRILPDGSEWEYTGLLRDGPFLFNPRGEGAPLYWDGEFREGTFAPFGTYKFRVRALKIYGDPENEDDWESVETPTFKILYEDKLPIERRPEGEPNLDNVWGLGLGSSSRKAPTSWTDRIKGWLGL